MAPISPGTKGKASRRTKDVPQNSNLHRFEPFSKRIAKLKIDPIRRVDRASAASEKNDISYSHFRESLQYWADLNLSRHYTDFAKKVQPLAESLPQVLHHADAIFDLLFSHIAQRDELSLEALLSLVAHFSHDLGSGFEKYFEKTVTLVAQLAASSEAADVIEWCFTCLTWIFKFLSRLLAPDLRALLSIMAPYLYAQKAYVARFTAESLAFLLRKVAMMYPRDKSPLTKAVTFLLNHNPDESMDNRAQAGVMTLFTEAAIGTGDQLHGSALHLIQCMCDVHLNELEPSVTRLCLIDGVLTAVIHSTDSEGFAPLSRWIHQCIAEFPAEVANARWELFQRLLCVLISTRKGTRVDSWPSVFESILTLTHSAADVATITKGASENLGFIAGLAIQYSPENEVSPYLETILTRLETVLNMSMFFTFCELSATLGYERFQALVLPFLQQYIISRWRHDEQSSCFALYHFHKIANEMNPVEKQPAISIPEAWEDRTANLLTDLHGKPERSVNVLEDGFLLNILEFKSGEKAQLGSRLVNVLIQAVLEELRSGQSSLQSKKRRFALGREFSAFVTFGLSLAHSPEFIWSSVSRLSPEHFAFPLFLESLCKYSKDFGPVEHLGQSDINTLRDQIMRNLLHNSDLTKRLSLQLLTALAAPEDSGLLEVVKLAQEILKLPYLPQNSRKIAMLLRHLPQHHKNLQKWARKVVPVFCLGLLPGYFDELRQNVCSVLAEIAQDAKDQSTIFEIALQWLQCPGLQATTRAEEPRGATHEQITRFQCSNAVFVRKLFDQIRLQFGNPQFALENIFEQDHKVEMVQPPAESRGIALKVLQNIPEAAEKHSRQLVPIFLSACTVDPVDDFVLESHGSTTSRTLSPDTGDTNWALADRRDFLNLFGRFQNPKVLYRSAEVYASLVQLLKNGNTAIQRLSLRALLNWKNHYLQKHEEELFLLLDEKSYSSQIGKLLGLDDSTVIADFQERNQVLDIVLPLLYGQMIGRPGTFSSQEAKRKATLRYLLRLDDSHIRQFFRVCLGRLVDLHIPEDLEKQSTLFAQDLVPLDHQYGMLKMLHSTMQIAQDQFGPFGDVVVAAVIFCTIRACRHLTVPSENKTTPMHTNTDALARNARKAGLQCLEMLFKHTKCFMGDKYLSILFKEVFSPRLDHLAVETGQGISWILRIFSTWSHSQEMVHFLTDYDVNLLQAVWDCIGAPTVRDDVKNFILEDIALAIVDLSTAVDAAHSSALFALEAHMETLLSNLASLLDSNPSREVFHHALVVLSAAASFAKSPSDVQKLLRVLVRAAQNSRRQKNPKEKALVVNSLRSLLKGRQFLVEPDIQTTIWDHISRMLILFKDTTNRTACCDILSTLANGDSLLRETAAICTNLNATISDRSLEPNYDDQVQTIQKYQKQLPALLSPKSFLPIANSLLHLSRTSDDYAVRANAISALKHALKDSLVCHDPELHTTIKAKIIPAVVTGFKDDSEAVRSDFVGLFAVLVQEAPPHFELDDLKVLLMGNDEEASFFTNVLHVQQHRRTRALRRLESALERGSISAKNVSMYLIPLVEKFVNYAAADGDTASLNGQALITLGRLLHWIEWPRFRTVLTKFHSELDSGKVSEKAAVNRITTAVDALTSAFKTGKGVQVADAGPVNHLASSLPSFSTISNEIHTKWLPKLTAFVHLKEETQLSQRLPIAVVAIKLASLLPETESAGITSTIILDVCQILRSRSQDSRDAARQALSKIVGLVGPSSLPMLLKELRSTLTRGYQRHVVAFTVHSILVESAVHWSPGDLDDCLRDVISVVMDDIFGSVGEEKANQDYVSSMKEVKRTKSFDTMELLAKLSSVNSLFVLIQPLQSLLEGALNSKQVHHTDELLRRVGLGLSQNSSASSRDVLVFAYQLIQRLHELRKQKFDPETAAKVPNQQDYLVKLTPAHKSQREYAVLQTFKIARFALDLVRSTLQKHGNLLTPENVHGFLPIIGDALVEGEEDVQISALRLLSTIIKLPIPELDENSQVYVLEAVKIIKNSVSTNGESPQAALKFLASILRERKQTTIRDSDLAHVLHRIVPDVEEPDRQGVTFNFIKAIMARQFKTPEIYDVVDRIGVMMVTNHASAARDAARGLYVHFLLSYPQSNSRWTRQIKFLLKNLEYKHPEGRQSVMEAVNVLISKLRGEHEQEIVSAFFLPLVLRLANDENTSSREMAALLLGTIFRKAEGHQLKTLLGALRSWTEQSETVLLKKVALQVYEVLVEVSDQIPEPEIIHMSTVTQRIIRRSGEPGKAADWELLHNALRLLIQLVNRQPAWVMSSGNISIWSDIRMLQSQSRTEIQTDVAYLLGLLLRDVAKTNSAEGLSRIPLLGTHGLELRSQAMLEILKHCLKAFKGVQESSELEGLLVQNTLLVGKALSSNGLNIEVPKQSIQTLPERETAGDSDLESLGSSETDGSGPPRSIPAIQYLLNQASSILRREPLKYTTASLTPKRSILALLILLLPYVSDSDLSPTLPSLLLPLTHLTDPQIMAPKSADPSFYSIYTALTTSAQEVLEAIQHRVGDAEYIRLRTEVGRTVRERRQERRAKRAVEKVAEPELAARKKRRKVERKKLRARELESMFKRRRQGL